MSGVAKRNEVGSVLTTAGLMLLCYGAMCIYVFGTGLNSLHFYSSLVSVVLCAWAAITDQLMKRVMHIAVIGVISGLVLTFAISLNKAGINAVSGLITSALILPLNYVTLMCFSTLIRRGYEKWIAR